MKSAFPLLLALTLVACGDNFADVQAADTIEAYEEFLTNNPDTRFKMEAEDRLETLYLKQAREMGLEGYDLYMKRFPEGNQMETAQDEREGFLFAWAENENTKEAWEKFLEEYPKAEKSRKRKAEAMLKVHKYVGDLELAAPVVEQVNLAEDPEGPLDGWKISADLTNNGERTFEEIRVTMVYLDEDSNKAGSKEWAAVAPYWKIPIEEEHKKPLGPGDTINWNWTTGNVPEGWSRQVKLYVSMIQVATKK